MGVIYVGCNRVAAGLGRDERRRSWTPRSGESRAVQVMLSRERSGKIKKKSKSSDGRIK